MIDTNTTTTNTTNTYNNWIFKDTVSPTLKTRLAKSKNGGRC